MKKASTWYLFALAILNVLLAIGTSTAADMWAGAYRQLGVLLPKVTLIALSLHWWPYLFVGVAILLALISISSRWQSSVFFHFIITFLVLECFVLFVAQVIFALPLIATLTLK
jgi:hypothetical protein